MNWKELINNPWFERCLYVVGAVLIVVPEFIAIFNNATGDTITENVRNVLDIAPLIWYVTLGGTLMFGYWFIRHMWWKKH